MVHDNIKGLALCFGIIDERCLSISNNAAIIHSPFAGALTAHYFMVSVELETNPFVFSEYVYLFPFPSRVKIQGIVLVTKAQGNDVGPIVFRQRKPAYR